MPKPNPHRLIDPTKNEEFQRQQREREEQLKDLLHESSEKKTEINPKYVGGEPVCSGSECPAYFDDFTQALLGDIEQLTIIGIKRKKEFEAALKRERELMREICNSASESAYDEGLAISPKMMAKQRGWPDDLFDGKDGE